MDSSVWDRRPLIRVHISSTMLFTWNFQPAMETATLIIFSVFQYPFLVMLKDGEPVIVEWFPAKSTTISVVFFWFGFILPLNHVLLIPISPSSDRLPTSGLSWRACRIAVWVFSAYGWVKYTDAPNGFPKHYGAWKNLMMFCSLNLFQWFDLYVSCYSFWRRTTSPYSIIFPPWEAPEWFNLFPIP